MLGSLTFALTLTLLATLAIYAKFKSYYEETVAAKIIVAEQVINHNQEAFRQLAIAGVPMRVVTEGNARVMGADHRKTGTERGYLTVEE